METIVLGVLMFTGVVLTLVDQQAGPPNRATLHGNGFASFTTEPVIAIRSTTLEAGPVVFRGMSRSGTRATASR